ncbi:MAG: ATP-binding cassette domain-containing protein [Ruminococcus sp.]|nr:ATP-binding cassette domain-containing protein [Ruminococcus sp.]
MLKLTEIRKSYKTFNFTQTALDGVSVSFRNNEFAAILGPSGSGKTTMLNIIGGLDHYDSGELEIDGISTKKYKSGDWDTYRNNRIGFVFQSYNLIPHQSILANVELALTLSGVSPAERKERAAKALEEVGLGEHVRKLPSQLSGGQMQRVAIARALINDPEILLADEPTGALDTKTSEQVMELLTQIAKDRLVIMVTHNPELADQYANRIIRLKDGQIVSDTNPLDPEKEEQHPGAAPRKVSMSLFTAISLSLSNLMTKKGRTFVVSLAGSIGIIGIAAILALASGINAYIKDIEEETMSIYPLTIQESGIDYGSLFASMGSSSEASEKDKEEADTKSDGAEKVKERKIVEGFFQSQNKNDLKSLKTHIDKNEKKINPYVKTIQYVYDVTPQIYLADTTDGADQVSPDSLLSSYGIGAGSAMTSIFGSGSNSGMNVFHELPGKSEMYDYQYEIKAGRWPENYDETVLVLMPDGSISDYVLYAMGLRDRTELKDMLKAMISNPEVEVTLENEDISPSYKDMLGAKFKVISAAKRYEYDDGYKVWVDKADNQEYMKSLVEQGLDLKVVGVVQGDPDAAATSLSPGINYTPELIQYLMEDAAKEDIVKQQLENPEVNVLTGKSFAEEKEENAQSDFEFADLITIDEEAIKNAFGVDSSKINLDLSGLGNLSINTDGVEMPEMNLEDITQSLAGQINIPQEQLTGIMNGVMQSFLAEQIAQGVTDPTLIVANLQEYLNRADVQASIGEQIGQVIGESQIDVQINDAVQMYVSTALESYMTQFMTSLQTQLQAQIQNQIQGVMAQLPQQMQNAFSIDQNAFIKAFQINMSENEIMELMTTMMSREDSSYESNLTALGYSTPDNPSQINLYPKDFNAKAEVEAFLKDYNNQMEDAGKEDKVINYTDLVGTMMSSVTDIVDTISYALIAFVAISLIVSSIMIGVITYISVLERKKEIGILRAIGASKRDVRRVFNAETMIIGFVAGLLGILVTYMVSIVANIIVYNKLDIKNIAQLPINAAIILIGISMLLAFISGLFPSSAAARKDPVEALRSE